MKTLIKCIFDIIMFLMTNFIYQNEKKLLASDYEKTKDIALLQRMMKIDKTLRSLKNGDNND